MSPLNHWTPQKLILTCVVVGVLSSALTGGLVVWLVSGPKVEQTPVFDPGQRPEAAPEITGDPVQAGNRFYDQQNWTAAIAAYEKALAAGMDTADLRTDLGNCHRFSNQPEQALEQYRLAQKKDPAHELSLFNQASLFAEVLHDHDQADAVAREFIRRFPASPNVEAVRKYLK